MNEPGFAGSVGRRRQAHRPMGVWMVLLIGVFGINQANGGPSTPSLVRSDGSGASEAAAASVTLAGTIDYLLASVEQSKLTFIRNGEEHDSRAAAAHLRRKYEQLRGSIATPEEFIEKVASRSWTSGAPYLVRLAGGREMRVDAWLRNVLKERRR